MNTFYQVQKAEYLMKPYPGDLRLILSMLVITVVN